MNIPLLDDILRGCLSHEKFDEENPPDHIRIVDVYALKMAVDLNRARLRRDELVQVLSEYPTESWGHPIQPLSDGPGYIEVGAAVGDQRRAFMLFAVGEALGFWNVVTPTTFGFCGSDASELAGRGGILIDGYHP